MMFLDYFPTFSPLTFPTTSLPSSPFLPPQFLLLLTICLAIAGAAEVHYVETARGLFIAIIFFSCLGALVYLVAKLGRRSAATNKYQVGSMAQNRTFL